MMNSVLKAPAFFTCMLLWLSTGSCFDQHHKAGQDPQVGALNIELTMEREDSSCSLNKSELWMNVRQIEVPPVLSEISERVKVKILDQADSTVLEKDEMHRQGLIRYWFGHSYIALQENVVIDFCIEDSSVYFPVAALSVGGAFPKCCKQSMNDAERYQKVPCVYWIEKTDLSLEIYGRNGKISKISLYAPS